MAEIHNQGVMAMVKIDGSKVKQLREQKGLTQLYVATVVQVTTDTISRWENKRYPTIKKENGLRLAEALEVELSEILESELEDEEQSDSDPSLTPVITPDTATEQQTRGSRWPVLFIFLIVAILTTTLGWYVLRQSGSMQITAKRILPNQCTAGQPFPVTIEVTGPAATPFTIILREQIPDAMSILGTNPSLPTPGGKNKTLKWLQKTEGRYIFTYIAKLSKSLPADQFLSGSVATSSNSEKLVSVTGHDTIQLTTFHWADSDGDNTISDKEILTVYDQYGDLEKLGIDIDLIEEIWLGSGYSWNASKKKYEILP